MHAAKLPEFLSEGGGETLKVPHHCTELGGGDRSAFKLERSAALQDPNVRPSHAKEDIVSSIHTMPGQGKAGLAAYMCAELLPKGRYADALRVRQMLHTGRYQRSIVETLSSQDNMLLARRHTQ